MQATAGICGIEVPVSHALHGQASRGVDHIVGIHKALAGRHRGVARRIGLHRADTEVDTHRPGAAGESGKVRRIEDSFPFARRIDSDAALAQQGGAAVFEGQSQSGPGFASTREPHAAGAECLIAADAVITSHHIHHRWRGGHGVHRDRGRLPLRRVARGIDLPGLHLQRPLTPRDQLAFLRNAQGPAPGPGHDIGRQGLGDGVEAFDQAHLHGPSRICRTRDGQSTRHLGDVDDIVQGHRLQCGHGGHGVDRTSPGLVADTRVAGTVHGLRFHAQVGVVAHLRDHSFGNGDPGIAPLHIGQRQAHIHLNAAAALLAAPEHAQTVARHSIGRYRHIQHRAVIGFGQIVVAHSGQQAPGEFGIDIALQGGLNARGRDTGRERLVKHKAARRGGRCDARHHLRGLHADGAFAQTVQLRGRQGQGPTACRHRGREVEHLAVAARQAQAERAAAADLPREGDRDLVVLLPVDVAVRHDRVELRRLWWGAHVQTRHHGAHHVGVACRIGHPVSHRQVGCRAPQSDLLAGHSQGERLVVGLQIAGPHHMGQHSFGAAAPKNFYAIAHCGIGGPRQHHRHTVHSLQRDDATCQLRRRIGRCRCCLRARCRGSRWRGVHRERAAHSQGFHAIEDLLDCQRDHALAQRGVVRVRQGHAPVAVGVHQCLQVAQCAATRQRQGHRVARHTGAFNDHARLFFCQVDGVVFCHHQQAGAGHLGLQHKAACHHLRRLSAIGTAGPQLHTHRARAQHRAHLCAGQRQRPLAVDHLRGPCIHHATAAHQVQIHAGVGGPTAGQGQGLGLGTPKHRDRRSQTGLSTQRNGVDAQGARLAGVIASQIGFRHGQGGAAAQALHLGGGEARAPAAIARHRSGTGCQAAQLNRDGCTRLAQATQGLVQLRFGQVDLVVARESVDAQVAGSRVERQVAHRAGADVARAVGLCGGQSDAAFAQLGPFGRCQALRPSAGRGVGKQDLAHRAQSALQQQRNRRPRLGSPPQNHLGLLQPIDAVIASHRAHHRCQRQ